MTASRGDAGPVGRRSSSAERPAATMNAADGPGPARDAPALAEVDAATARSVRADLARAVRNGKEYGEVEPDADPEPAAVRLLAVTEGLALQIHRDPATEELARSVLDSELAATFTGPCRQYKNP